MKQLPAQLILAILATGAVAAQPTTHTAELGAFLAPLLTEAAITSDCDGGTVYDDGVYEDGYGSTQTFGFSYFGQRTAAPYSAAKVERICVCLQRTTGASSGTIDLLVHSANPDGTPKELIAFEEFSVASVPTGVGGKFYSFDVSDLDIFAESPMYIGLRWDEDSNPGFFVCADESLSTPKQRAFFDAGLLAGAFPPFLEIGTASAIPEYRALGVRAVFSPASCLPDADTLCLSGGRFQVEATFNTGSQAGVARVVKLTDETGYLWFFSAGNVEAIIKVLNGCTLNSRYWVFTAGLTNVNVTITVTDTETGDIKTYENPANTKYVAIQDTSAFATCP